MSKSSGPRRQPARRSTKAEVPAAGVQSLDRAMRLLETLGEDAEGYRLVDLATRTGLPSSTAHRLLTSLESRGFTQFDRDAGTWHVGHQTFAIGSTYLRRRNFVATAMPTLRTLRDETRETANLGIADGGEIVILAQVESRETVRAISIVGGRAQMTNDALGKAILSAWSDEDVADIVRRHGLKAVTSTTITRAGALQKELRQIRKDGYALDRGEHTAELRCAAAPIFDAANEAIAALSVSGIASRLPEERLLALAEKVRAAAGRLSESLGARPA